MKRLLCVVACLVVLVGPALADSGVRESILAGTWYPEDPGELRAMIDTFLGNVPERKIPGRLKALISPHAGYVYSGPVAAHAYKLLAGQRFDTVVVLAPSHRVSFQGISVYDRGGYRTPLGEVELDKEFIAALKQAGADVRYVAAAHAEEHSLEIQLPFLQVVMSGFRLVPLVMGSQDRQTCAALARALATCAQDRSVLLLASSDLSHYHTSGEAASMDSHVLASVENLDVDALFGCLRDGHCQACGGGPIAVAMLAAMAMGADAGVVLDYGDSGDVTGDHSNVVGYMAAALMETEGNGVEKEKVQNRHGGNGQGEFSPEERAVLHEIAREAVKAGLEGRTPPEPEGLTPLLREERGAFVTLTENGQLRGCIGHIVGSKPLYETVAEMAYSAAFEDPRFRPVEAAEYGDLEYEISVLTPLRRVESPEEVVVGEHGLLVQQGGYRGLLLPQVATEYGWDREEFLSYTCRKAGLPLDAWKDSNTEIFVFSAEVF